MWSRVDARVSLSGSLRDAMDPIEPRLSKEGVVCIDGGGVLELVIGDLGFISFTKYTA